MALEKDIPTQFGVGAKYWNIALIQNNLKDRVMFVKFYGYATKEQRLEGSAPMHVIDKLFQGEEYKNEMTLKEIYQSVKNNEDFNGSIDI